MKRLFFFMIIVSPIQYSFCGDSKTQSIKKSSVCVTLSQGLNNLWNEDTGTVCKKFSLTEHEKQESQENVFYCDISSCKRRDVRRTIMLIGFACTVGAIAMPHLAVPIVSYGAISTTALAFPLVVYQSPDDPRTKIE